MRTGPSTTRHARMLATLIGVVASLALAAPAMASGGVNGADFTTMNTTFDGTGHCKNGNGNVNCNIYDGKQYVWTNGGPDTNKLLPDGYYFFAVLVPGGQSDPNDGATDNLSDDYDAWTNRTFRITNGEISSYTGTHIQGVDTNDNNERKIRLYPYADTTNNGGVYIMATCYLGTDPSHFTYPVVPKTCKYDAFKAPTDDTTPPVCPKPTFFTNSDGKWTAQAKFSDAGGIDTIEVVSFVNTTPTFDSWYMGTTKTITLTAPKIDNHKSAQVVIYVRDVAGNQTTCDPVLARVGAGKQVFRHLTRHESRVTIRNGRPGLSRMVVRVNHHAYVVRLKAGERRTLFIRKSLVRGAHNIVSLRGVGAGRAMVMVSN
jgi:hypothetical protein